MPLPPYSPELNPIEGLWREIRRRIGIFDEAVCRKLEALRGHVAVIVCTFTPEQFQWLTGYSYLFDAANAL